MTTTIYHYVYRITNTIIGKHYYGTRTSKGITPKEDLGTKYISSSLDKNFISEQREHPENFKYKVIRQFKDRVSATEFEIFLHTKYDVKTNPKFYNRANQTSTGFDFTFKSHSTKSLQKISKSSKGRIVTKETRLKISKANTGNIMSIETRDKMSIAKKNISIETRDKMSNSQSGHGNNKNKGKGWYILHDQKFESSYELSEHINVDQCTILNWCKKYNDKKIHIISYSKIPFLQSLGSKEQIVGKTYNEIGFNFELLP